MMEEGKFREPVFCGAPRTANMHNAASKCIENSQPHDACWRHAQWARTLRQSRVLRGTNIFTVNWKRTHLSCADTPMSHFSSLRRNRMGVFGKRVQVHWAWGQQCSSVSLASDKLSACTKALLAVRGAPFAKGFSPWQSSF
jgi:hypothetical protein